MQAAQLWEQLWERTPCDQWIETKEKARWIRGALDGLRKKKKWFDFVFFFFFFFFIADQFFAHSFCSLVPSNHQKREKNEVPLQEEEKGRRLLGHEVVCVSSSPARGTVQVGDGRAGAGHDDGAAAARHRRQEASRPAVWRRGAARQHGLRGQETFAKPSGAQAGEERYVSVGSGRWKGERYNFDGKISLARKVFFFRVKIA